MGFARNSSSAAAAWTRSAVVALILPGLARARDTVDGLTPASSAMS